MSFYLQADRPSKNRVWDFLDDSFSYALKSSSQVVELHQENSGVATTSASGVFKFSSKYHDQETDLVYYGFRYLNTDTGRWISRDPFEEYGGINLYATMLNTPVSSFDFLGLALDTLTGSIEKCLLLPTVAARVKCLEGLLGLFCDDCAVNAAIKGQKHLLKSAGDLIKGSLKHSKSYHSELAGKTYEEILKMASGKGPLAKKAKGMKKLIEQAARLLEKTKCKRK